MKRWREREKNRCASNATNGVKDDAMSAVGSDAMSVVKNKRANEERCGQLMGYYTGENRQKSGPKFEKNKVKLWGIVRVNNNFFIFST